ncbi:hypothetical protein ABZ135_32770 [Streptomyces sp. NPDC006339]|uniref:hypothetical protein n=1 Tax=Streptomyces sp. NPDC006339 TaxID=3156755 RepID=UPI0033B038A4
MSYQHKDLNLTDPTRGSLHFVMYTELRMGLAFGALNAHVTFHPQQQTPLTREWVDRLERCEPNALHCSLVSAQQEIPALFHPCVEEDKESPSAFAGSGCECRRSFYDLEFGMPVVGEHYRTVSGNIDQWFYRTYAPLDLRPDDVFDRFIVDNGHFWVRTEKGLLSILPQQTALGYGVGYEGGGPHALAAYLSEVAATGGKNTAAGAPYEKADPGILAWTESPHRTTNELTLQDLKALRRG